MRRADRLFSIVLHLRGGRLVTARGLAGRLEVSERTIYRDIADLQSCGVPIEGEAGVGYLMREGYTLPPLMFTREEVVALVAGAKLVRAWGGLAMAQAAQDALLKIEAVLPEGVRERVATTSVEAFGAEMREVDRERLDLLERAAEGRRRLQITYIDGHGRHSERAVRPLGLCFWGKVWTLAAWCELRRDFRVFRIDRIQGVDEVGGFAVEPGRTLRDFYRTACGGNAVDPGFQGRAGRGEGRDGRAT